MPSRSGSGSATWPSTERVSRAPARSRLVVLSLSKNAST